MKKIIKYLTPFVIILMSGLVIAQEKMLDKLSVPFSQPSKPGLVKASLISGGITVEGYDGKEVLVEATARSSALKSIARDRDRGREWRRYSNEDDEKSNKKDKAKGMQKLEINTTGLTVEEDDNVIKISTNSWKRAIDLLIKVPRKTSLNLHCVNDGDITVNNIEGEIEANNTNGGITITNISGSVVAHALNDDVTVKFDKVDSDKPMSFSSMNGDIDVTFPSDIKANVILKSTQGDIYSDFDISKHEVIRNMVSEDTRKEGGKYKIRFEEGIQVKINGGGPEIKFNNFNGDVYLRKGK